MKKCDLQQSRSTYDGYIPTQNNMIYNILLFRRDICLFSVVGSIVDTGHN